MIKVDMAKVAELVEYGKGERLQAHQAAVFVMCGGGMLGHLAAEQPADFYIDDRCGRLPYGKREILQAVAVLAVLAKAAGLDPHHLPDCPRFHNCGIF